jgi:hypothetical protein
VRIRLTTPLVVLVAACSTSTDSSSQSQGNSTLPTFGGTGSVVIDGVTANATFLDGSIAQNLVTVQGKFGADSTLIALRFRRDSIGSQRLVTFAPGTPWASIARPSPSALWLSVDSLPGTIAVSASTQTVTTLGTSQFVTYHITGTFAFAAVSGPPPASPAQRLVSSGTFDVTFPYFP